MHKCSCRHKASGPSAFLGSPPTSLMTGLYEVPPSSARGTPGSAEDGDRRGFQVWGVGSGYPIVEYRALGASTCSSRMAWTWRYHHPVHNVAIKAQYPISKTACDMLISPACMTGPGMFPEPSSTARSTESADSTGRP